MNNEIAVRSQSNEINARINYGMPTEHEMMVFQTMCKSAVESKMYKGIGDQAGVMMIMLAARELGIPPCQAINGGLNIIQGKVEISARMMSALIRRSGHQIKVEECSSTQCVLVGKRCDTGETQVSSFSVEEAKLAGLIKVGGGWTKWPKDMCFARALSRLARQLFSDVIGIGYVEGEISQAVEIKNSGIDEMNSDQFTIDEYVREENEQEFIDKFLNIFDKEDRYFAMEWLNIIEKHFEWTTLQAIKEVIKDEKKLIDKFNSWKSKQKKENENE